MSKKQYQKCDVCGKVLPRDRNYFVRYTNNPDGLIYHTACKDCELQMKMNKEWKDGKLLCHKCGQYKDPECFNKKSDEDNIRMGKDTRCNECKRKQQYECDRKASPQEKLRKTLQHRWLGAKDRAQKKGIPFSITKEDLKNLWDKQKGKCALSGLPMTYELRQGRIYSNVSIDQIEHSKGYTPDNIQLVCMAVNQLKSDFDMQTIYKICEAICRNAARWGK